MSEAIHPKKRMQIHRILDQLMENADSIEGLVLCVEFSRKVKEPIGSRDERGGDETNGYTISIDARPSIAVEDTDDVPGIEVTTLTLGLAERVKNRVSLRRHGGLASLFG